MLQQSYLVMLQNIFLNLQSISNRDVKILFTHAHRLIY